MRNVRTSRYVAVAQKRRKRLAKLKEIGGALSLPTNSVAVLFEVLPATPARSRSDNLPLQFPIELELDGESRIVEASGDLSRRRRS
jgi:hypothetical protein